MRLQPLLTSSAVIDLGVVLQDLVELCQSPLVLGAPEVGRATLAVSHATAVLSRATTAEETDAEDIQEQVREALARSREAVAAARHCVERSRAARDLALDLTATSIRLRQPRSPITDVPPLLRAWTTRRYATVACPACQRPCVVHYEYRFMEGLAARDLQCPHGACEGRLTYYIPVNASGVSVIVGR